MAEVITFGETMVSIRPFLDNKLEQSPLWSPHIAGAESNVALALSKLGHQVKWISRVGNDPFGRMILKELRGEGVDVSEVIIDQEHRTGIMFKDKNLFSDSHVYYYRDDSAASYLRPEDISVQSFTQAKLLHITGITPLLSSSCLETIYHALNLARKYRLIVSMDPNLRFKLSNIRQAKDIILDLLEYVDIFLPGYDEAAYLFDTENETQMIQACLNRGISIVVLKKGAQGALLATKEKKCFIPAFRADYVVDEIGAGDAFAAGFLHGVLNDETLEHAVKIAHAMALFVISSQGDTEGLPTKEELYNFLSQNKVVSR